MDRLPKTYLQMQLSKLAWIVMFWLIIAIGEFFFEYEVLINHGNVPDSFPFWRYFLSHLISVFIGGIIGGSIMVFYLEKWFREHSYGQAMLLVFVQYTLISMIVAYFGFGFLYKYELQQSFFSPAVQDEIWGYLISLDYLKNFFLWLMITFISIAALLINDKYGPGVLKDFLLGKYFHPTREERIFMFLDLRNSTQIAEKLGEAAYFNFLKDLFKDSTIPIINSRGEIYQYVGDEIVVTWKMDRGLKNANCVRCFFDIQEAIRKRNKYYQKTYGYQPEFKAGFHYGHVMTGEIGVVKRDIIFSGDVLNTASRIQGKCNDFGVNILLSKYLIDKLSLPPNTLQPAKIGELQLRGKQKYVALYTIQ